MADRIERGEAQAFHRRWAAINRCEIEELRQTSAAVKIRQLASLMASAEAMGWLEDLQREEAEVRERWLRLRKAFDVR